MAPAVPVRETQSLNRVLDDVQSVIPPLWSLSDYVAVNPCVGLIDQPFLSACQTLRSVRDCELLMPRSYYKSLFNDGKLTVSDLESAHARCLAELPEWYGQFELAELMDWLTEAPQSAPKSEVRFRTVAEAVDLRQGSTWSSHIVNDLTRHCATHYDEGQAAWASPWKEDSLYTSWREASRLSRRMEMLGLTGFRAFVAGLPSDPRRAVDELLAQLSVPATHWRSFLLCQAFSVAGWASYVRNQVQQSAQSGETVDDLIGLLAIRLAYDAALAHAPGIPWPLPLWPADSEVRAGRVVAPRPDTDVLARYVVQEAAEQAYHRELCGKLATRAFQTTPAGRKALQMVFCIDVRSEVMRRHLESVEESIETFGFAGFFGMPMEFIPLGCDHGTPQCPVLLQPGFQVHETLRDVGASVAETAAQQRLSVRWGRKIWKSFQTSAASCFSFVESIGLSYLGRLLTDSLQWTRPAASATADGLSTELVPCLGPDIHAGHNQGLDWTRRIDLAEGMLRNLGLTTGFARVVALCGHASDVTNNPYRAALDCGACGGHSGEPNARVAAALLNDPDVRAGLATRGIHIPADTWFLAATHNTTTDEISIHDLHRVPESHEADLVRIQDWLELAGAQCRAERCGRLGSADPQDVLRRSRDWSEVRPEWGLAGNAAFVVAPRARTAGLNLGGRTFLHSYDHRLDPELKVLELILTAPMVVTNWINMQYFASSVDPVAFGSGNKVIHNVVGQFGVLQGNGGDLMTGLPWQSVHDGQIWQHEPLRLRVVVEAPRAALEQIIRKHPVVANLVTNGWVTLVAWEGSTFSRWTRQRTWEAQTLPSQGGTIPA